jgi:hypothetical protein
VKNEKCVPPVATTMQTHTQDRLRGERTKNKKKDKTRKKRKNKTNATTSPRDHTEMVVGLLAFGFALSLLHWLSLSLLLGCLLYAFC